MADKRVRDELDSSLNDSNSSSTKSPPQKQRNISPALEDFEDAPDSPQLTPTVPIVSDGPVTTMSDEIMSGVFRELKKINDRISNLKTEMLEVVSSKMETLVKGMFESLARDLKDEIRQNVTKDIKDEFLKETKEELKSFFKKESDSVLRKVKSQIDNHDDFINKLQNDSKKNEEDYGKAASKIESFGEMIHDRMMFFENKLLDQEARSRRDNVVVFGIKEEEKEDCKVKMRELFKKECKVEKEYINIHRAHRLGPERPNMDTNPRPIIVKFHDYNDKLLVKQGRDNLPKDVKIADDLPGPIRDAQRSLLPELKQAKDDHQKAYIRFPASLVINGEVVKSVNPIEFVAAERQRSEASATQPATGSQGRRDGQWQVAGDRRSVGGSGRGGGARGGGGRGGGGRWGGARGGDGRGGGSRGGSRGRY